MDRFNRALGVAVGVLIAVGGITIALVAAGAVSPATIAPAGWFRQGFQEIAWLTTIKRTLVVALGSTSAGAGVFLIAAELVPVMRHRYIAAGHGTNREFAVREGAVERMVRFAGREVEGVRTIEHAHVRRGGRGLDIACTAVIEPDALAGPLAPLLEARLFNAVYTMTGLPVGEVRLRIRHAESERQAIVPDPE